MIIWCSRRYFGCDGIVYELYLPKLKNSELLTHFKEYFKEAIIYFFSKLLEKVIKHISRKCVREYKFEGRWAISK